MLRYRRDVLDGLWAQLRPYGRQQRKSSHFHTFTLPHFHNTIHPKAITPNLEMHFEVGGVQYVALGATPVGQVSLAIGALMLMRI